MTGPLGRDAESSRGFQEGVCLQLARKVEILRCIAVDLDVEEVGDPRLLQDEIAVPARGDHGGLETCGTQPANQCDGAVIDLDTPGADRFAEEPVLAVPQSMDGVAVRRILGFAHGQLDAAGGQKVFDAHLAGFAVDVATVVAIRIEGDASSPSSRDRASR